MLKRRRLLLSALAVFFIGIYAGDAGAVAYAVRKNGSSYAVYDPYLKRWVATGNPSSYMRASYKKYATVEGFGNPIGVRDFQRNTPVTDAAVQTAKQATALGSRVPVYGSLSNPPRRMVGWFDKSRQAKYR